MGLNGSVVYILHFDRSVAQVYSQIFKHGQHPKTRGLPRESYFEYPALM